MSRVLDLWIRIAQSRQIRGARPRVQFGKKRIIERLGFQFRDPARRIIDVAEHNRLRRARSLASRLDLAIVHAAALFFRFDLALVDALHAVRALFHYAAASYRNVGIALQLETGCVPVRVEEKVEAPHLIWAVVRAVACPDTAV